MMKTNTNPLVSLCITCYNQAKYIREAVQSAFDQTYDPLEIVICDDCSTDGTDEIVKEMIAEYKSNGGRHAIVFKRNEKNLYVLKNYEQAFRMAHGELLITGAGDDVSLPNRAARIVEEWEKSRRQATCIMNGWYAIDLDGKVLYESRPWRLATLLGASTTYVRKVVDEFAELPAERGIYEDDIFSGRAAMFGFAAYIDEPLMKYRIGNGETTKVDFLEHRRRVDHHVLRSCEIVDAELEAKNGVISDERYEATLKLEAWRKRRYAAEQDLCTGKTIFTRLNGFLNMTPEYGWGTGKDRYLDYFPLIFPRVLRPMVGHAVSMYWFLRHCCGLLVKSLLKGIVRTDSKTNV